MTPARICRKIVFVDTTGNLKFPVGSRQTDKEIVYFCQLPTNRQKNNETDRINIILLSVFQLPMEKYTVFLCVLVTPTEKFILTSAGERNAQPTWAWAALAFQPAQQRAGYAADI